MDHICCILEIVYHGTNIPIPFIEIINIIHFNLLLTHTDLGSGTCHTQGGRMPSSTTNWHWSLTSHKLILQVSLYNTNFSLHSVRVHIIHGDRAKKNFTPDMDNATGRLVL